MAFLFGLLARRFRRPKVAFKLLPVIHYKQRCDHSRSGNRPPITRKPGVNDVHGLHS